MKNTSSLPIPFQYRDHTIYCRLRGKIKTKLSCLPHPTPIVINVSSVNSSHHTETASIPIPHPRNISFAHHAFLPNLGNVICTSFNLRPEKHSKHSLTALKALLPNQATSSSSESHGVRCKEQPRSIRATRTLRSTRESPTQRDMNFSIFSRPLRQMSLKRKGRAKCDWNCRFARRTAPRDQYERWERISTTISGGMGVIVMRMLVMSGVDYSLWRDKIQQLSLEESTHGGVSLPTMDSNSILRQISFSTFRSIEPVWHNFLTFSASLTVPYIFFTNDIYFCS